MVQVLTDPATMEKKSMHAINIAHRNNGIFTESTIANKGSRIWLNFKFDSQLDLNTFVMKLGDEGVGELCKNNSSTECSIMI